MSGLPTWILMRMLMRFAPKDHPWRGYRFTLEDWSRGESELCRQFDIALWMSVPILLGTIFGMLLK